MWRKKLGLKQLYEELNLTIQSGEKVGLIGRNGVGKTTLLGIMDGTDGDFSGSVERRRGLHRARRTCGSAGYFKNAGVSTAFRQAARHAAGKT